MFSPLSERIVVDPEILAGKPVIRGTRLAVEFNLELLAAGQSENEVLTQYPGLTREDILACLLPDQKNSSLALGLAIHRALELNFREKIQTHEDLDTARVVMLFRDAWMDRAGQTQFTSDESQQELRRTGERLVVKYMDEVAPQVEPAAVELDVAGEISEVAVRAESTFSMSMANSSTSRRHRAGRPGCPPTTPSNWRPIGRSHQEPAEKCALIPWSRPLRPRWYSRHTT